MKLSKTLISFLLIMTVFSACKKENHHQQSAPIASDVEIGLANNQIGVIGRDFHFNAKILAGDKIDVVKIAIQPKSGETYAKPWKYEIVWTEFRDAKNATVHKHFDIPADAVEGKYDFLITVTDQNGLKLEIKNNITIYDALNLPVDPKLSIFNLFLNGEIFYRNGKFNTPGRPVKKGDLLNAQASILNVKGDGKIYLLLIKKSLNHRPESIAAIDFSKVIVYDYFEHQGWTATQAFSNTVYDQATYTSVRNWPDLTIGAANDNRTPPASITGEKAWASGNYYFGMIYQNTTYNSTLFNYIELSADMN